MLRVFYTRIDPLYDDSFFEKKLSFVSEERQKKVLSYKNQADRCRSLAVGLLFMYGCGQVGFTQKVLIGENGKPLLTQPDAYFNLSHAGDYAVAVFSDRPVGIDVECCGRFCENFQELNLQQNEQKRVESEYEQKRFESENNAPVSGKADIRLKTENHNTGSAANERMENRMDEGKRMQRIARKIFTPQEMTDWECIPLDDNAARESALIRIWTRKEAFSKMKGNGLSLDFSKIDTYSESCFLSWKLGNECWVSVAFSD